MGKLIADNGKYKGFFVNMDINAGFDDRGDCCVLVFLLIFWSLSCLG